MIGRILSATCLALSYVLLGGAAVSFLTGSSCFYAHGCDDDDDHFDDDDDRFDDDDDFCDDDDDDDPSPSLDDPAWRALAAADPELFRVEHYTLVIEEAGDRLDVRALADIRGITLSEITPQPAYSNQALRVFGDRLLAANQTLIGLPPARFRRFAGIFEVGQGRGIAYEFDPGDARPSGRIHVLLDPFGRLVSIEKLLGAETER